MLIDAIMLQACIASGAKRAEFFHIIVSKIVKLVGKNLPTRFQPVSQIVQLVSGKLPTGFL